MNPIKARDYQIVFNKEGLENLANFINEHSYSGLFIIVDTHTHEHCLPYFIANLATEVPIEVIEIPHGEAHKTIETCTGVWNALAELGADRKGLVINVGGGVVTDLGGFVASTFKRGMDFINVPTSLLAMVDASVGGKTGVDLGTLKNLVGMIHNPKMVLVDPGFLATLPASEMRSGLAEMYKHGLIASSSYWNELSQLDSLKIEDLNRLIYESIRIKNTVVLEDPMERGLRKTLNYGHTLGHAIESYHLAKTNKTTLLHGEAIAIGMILESYLSSQITGLSQKETDQITKVFSAMYDAVAFEKADIEAIIDYLKYDKKNVGGQINFVLLKSIGSPMIDQNVPTAFIYDAFSYYTTHTTL